MTLNRPILVIGNCQTQMMVDALATIDTNMSIVGHRYRRNEPENLILMLKKHIGHKYVPIISSSLRMESELIDFLTNHSQLTPVFFPSLTFSAFHPDVQFAESQGQAVRNGLGSTWNSRLALSAYLGGNSTKQAQRLFCADIYKEVGYFDRWDTDIASLKNTFEFCSLDFTRWIRRVQRLGVFMHGINHPVKGAIQQLAIQVSERLKMPKKSSIELERYSQDNLSTSIWPVYPEIAEHFGFVGSYTFQHQGKNLDLTNFISECYATWDQQKLTKKAINTIPKTQPSFESIIERHALK